MTHVSADRVKETSTTTGTGTLNLAGAASGFRSFVDAIGDGNTCWYCITDGTSFEIGKGTVAAGTPNTLARNTVLGNHLGTTAKVNWGAGTRNVFATMPADALTACFVAHKGGTDQTAIATATQTKLTMGTVAVNQGGHYDSATSRWTPPSGNGRIAANALLTGGIVDGSLGFLTLYKNGSEYRRGPNVRFAGTGNVSLTLNVPFEADGDDYFELYVQANDTGDKTVDGNATLTYWGGEMN